MSVKGFPPDKVPTVTLGGVHKFTGTITAPAKITKVTLSVEGTGREITAAPNTTTYDLSKLQFDTSLPEFGQARTYTIGLHVRTEGAKTDTDLGTMTLQVKAGVNQRSPACR